MAPFRGLLAFVSSGALVLALLLPGCAVPKYHYYFDRQSYEGQPSALVTPGRVNDSSRMLDPVQPMSASSSLAVPADFVMKGEKSRQHVFRDRSIRPAMVALGDSLPMVQVKEVESGTAQDPVGAKKNGWMGISSLLLIVGGLLLLMKANWEWVGAGMILTGLILAIITSAKKEKSKKAGATSTPKNAGAAKAGLFVLGLVVFVLGVLAIIAFFSLFNM